MNERHCRQHGRLAVDWLEVVQSDGAAGILFIARIVAEVWAVPKGGRVNFSMWPSPPAPLPAGTLTGGERRVCRLGECRPSNIECPANSTGIHPTATHRRTLGFVPQMRQEIQRSRRHEPNPHHLDKGQKTDLPSLACRAILCTAFPPRPFLPFSRKKSKGNDRSLFGTSHPPRLFEHQLSLSTRNRARCPLIPPIRVHPFEPFHWTV